MVGFFEGIGQIWQSQVDAATRTYENIAQPSIIPKVPWSSAISLTAVAVGIGALVFLWKK